MTRHFRATLACALLGLGTPTLGQSSDPLAPRLLAAAPASPDVFGTVAVGAGVTAYDSRFRRVAAKDRDHPLVLAIASQLKGLSPHEQLRRVQTEVRRRVTWAHDLDTMHVGDLWANAGETLQTGLGDSEDIAIAKMQILKAAGYNPKDLYISIGRDRKAGAHIVLLARTPTGFMVLDDIADRPISPRTHGRFTPVLTIGEGKSWVHGRRVRSMAARASAP